YLITRSLLRAQDRTPNDRSSLVRDFFKRRVLRIVPVFYVTLLLSLTLRHQRTPDIVWHFAFLSNVDFILKGTFVGANAHLWALAVEQHFYLFWPFVVLFIPRAFLSRAASAMIGTGLAFHALAIARGWSYLTFDVMTLAAFEALGCGALLACWMQDHEEVP